jgi:hypothetical protein
MIVNKKGNEMKKQSDITTEKMVREINELRFALFQTMTMWRSVWVHRDYMINDIDEVLEDWNELASSLNKRQWMVGIRAVAHYAASCRQTFCSQNALERVEDFSMSEQYINYSQINKFTEFYPPPMSSARLLKKGKERIRREFGVDMREAYPESQT